MPARWTDDHCHLGWDGDGPADPVLVDRMVDDARSAGVDRLVTVGTDRDRSADAIAAAARHPGVVWATVGLHPHDAKDGLAGLADLLGEPGVVAVGECGLDYHYDHSPRDVQRRAFAAQIGLAHEHDLALVIHTREAWDDTLRGPRRRGRARAHGVPLLHRRPGRGRGVPRPRRAPVVLGHRHVQVGRRRPRGRRGLSPRPGAGRDRQPLPGAGPAPRPPQPAGAACRWSAPPWPRPWARRSRRWPRPPGRRAAASTAWIELDDAPLASGGDPESPAGARPARRPRAVAQPGAGAELRGRPQHRPPHRPPGRGRPGRPGGRDRAGAGVAHAGARRDGRRGHRRRARPPPAAGAARGGRAARCAHRPRRCAAARLGRRARPARPGAPVGAGGEPAVQRGDPAGARPAGRRARHRPDAGDGAARGGGAAGRPPGRQGVRHPVGEGRRTGRTPRSWAGCRRPCSSRRRGSSRRSSAITRLPSPRVDADPGALFRLVEAGFGQRRKMLRRSLAGLVDADGFARAGRPARGPGRGARPRRLGPARRAPVAG